MNKEEPDGTNNNPAAQAVPKMEVPESSNSSDIKDEDGVWSADIEQVNIAKLYTGELFAQNFIAGNS